LSFNIRAQFKRLIWYRCVGLVESRVRGQAGRKRGREADVAGSLCFGREGGGRGSRFVAVDHREDGQEGKRDGQRKQEGMWEEPKEREEADLINAISQKSGTACLVPVLWVLVFLSLWASLRPPPLLVIALKLKFKPRFKPSPALPRPPAHGPTLGSYFCGKSSIIHAWLTLHASPRSFWPFLS
jgi:hypothetical protein